MKYLKSIDPINGVMAVGTLMFLGLIVFTIYCANYYGMSNPIASY